MILSRFSSFDRLNPWLQLLLSGLLGVVVFSPVALWLDYLFGQETFLSEKWLSQLLDEMAGMGPPVIISWLAMNAPWILGYRINQHDGIHAIESIEATEQPVDDVYTEPEFFKMLPAVIGNDVIFLKAELHYIEVNTVAGQALILYNLRDAIDELSYVSGIHCHRSYWVNLEHIKNFKKQGRQGQLMLSQGHKIPVSRTRISAVKNAVESAGTVQSTCV